jgi:hypothetical protein
MFKREDRWVKNPTVHCVMGSRYDTSMEKDKNYYEAFEGIKHLSVIHASRGDTVIVGKILSSRPIWPWTLTSKVVEPSYKIRAQVKRRLSRIASLKGRKGLFGIWLVSVEDGSES